MITGPSRAPLKSATLPNQFVDPRSKCGHIYPGTSLTARLWIAVVEMAWSLHIWCDELRSSWSYIFIRYRWQQWTAMVVHCVGSIRHHQMQCPMAHRFLGGVLWCLPRRRDESRPGHCLPPEQFQIVKTKKSYQKIKQRQNRILAAAVAKTWVFNFG